MGFKIRTFHEVLNRMANWVTSHTTELTNFHVGSALRTLLEGVSVELEALYFEMYKGFNYALENAVFNSFDFEKYPATYSQGEVTVDFRGELQQEVIFPRGFRFATIPSLGVVKTFVSTSEIICQKGVLSIKVPVKALEAGSAGNVSVNTITIVSSPLPIIDKVYNESAFTTGYPEESSEERKKRFILYIQTLARGTLSAVHYGCVSVPGVTGAFLSEKIGVVTAYVHDNNGELPEVLKNSIDKNLTSYRSAGIEVLVKPIERKLVDMHVKVYLNEGTSPEQIPGYEELVLTSLVEYINSFSVSSPLLRADIIRRLMTIGGVAIVNVEIDLEEDITVDLMELIRPGEVTVKAYISGQKAEHTVKRGD